VTHVLSSIPPDEKGDPALAALGGQLAERAGGLQWVGYLSTVGVYGDHGGAWVDEDTPPAPVSRRGKMRLAAERQWLKLHEEGGLPVHIFRLPGIYGPGRGPLEKARAGVRDALVVREGQVFSRIHVADLADALEASIKRPNPGAVYNVVDDEPAPPHEVALFAHRLLGLALPPLIPFEEAELSPMARSFYGESKRVSNARIKRELGWSPRHPTYREGLKALAGET
jgi:nucleoside-diphosphate-sugar epimerase